MQDDDIEARLDAALEQTFPASDPVAVSMPAAVDRAVLTVGHSTRPIAEFVSLLRAHRVTQLVDVRTVPRSRHNPQFNADVLPESLAAASIGYAHAPALGGLRPTHAGSANEGWRNLSFRGYADHMQGAEFDDALAGLIELAHGDRVALMCAEAVPWRCHRSLIADALLVHGVPAYEIVSAKRLQAHRLTRFAVVEGERITYPPSARSESPPLRPGGQDDVANSRQGSASSGSGAVRTRS